MTARNGKLATWLALLLALMLAVGGTAYTFRGAESKALANETRINKIEEQNGETLVLIRQIDRRQVRIMAKLGIEERSE